MIFYKLWEISDVFFFWQVGDFVGEVVDVVFCFQQSGMVINFCCGVGGFYFGGVGVDDYYVSVVIYVLYFIGVIVNNIWVN